MSRPERLRGLVLAGGISRRMGSDKASLRQADGEPQLQRAVRCLERHIDDVYVSTRQAQSNDPLRQEFSQIMDTYDDMGPVAGILSALDTDPTATWLVVACDLPNLDDSTISYLLDHASPEHAFTAYRSVHDELPEPLCAIYTPASRAIIKGFVADGIKCPRKMLINAPTLLLSQPSPGALHNVNTPDDLEGTDIRVAT